MLPREQKRDIDRNAGEDRRLDGGQSFLGAWNFDEEVGLAAALAEIARRGDRALRVMREKRRDLERYPAIDTVGAGEDGPQQIGSPGQIRQRQFEEQIFRRLRARSVPSDVAVVVGAVLDRMIEDRRIRGETRHREFVDVALQRAAVQEVAGDVVEPEALAEIVQGLCRVHRAGSNLDAGIGDARPWARQLEAEKIADAFDRDIGRRQGADHFRIASVAALPREHGRDAVPPEALDRRQDAQLVVDENVVFGWKTPLDVIEGLFLVNIDQHTSIDRIGQARAFDFVRLKDDVSVGQDNGRSEDRASRFNTLRADGNSRPANG